MVSRVIRNDALNNDPPDNMLDRQQNCAAMAFSRVLGINVHATLNLFIAKGWLANAGHLQYDGRIADVLAGLTAQGATAGMVIARHYTNTRWSDVKPYLKNLDDGRYFAVNTGVHDFGGEGIGHAFAILKNGGWGIYANNSQMGGPVGDQKQYSQRIHDTHRISIWGPF